MPLPASPVLSEAAVVLEYDRTPAAQITRPRWVRALALLVALLAAFTPFVRFTYDISPMYVAREFFRMLHEGTREKEMFLVLLAVPFFLGPAIVLAHLRLLVRDFVTRPERLILLSLAGASAAAVVGFFGFGLFETMRSPDPRDLKTMAVFSIGPALLGAGFFLLWRLRRCGFALQTGVIASLHISYVANAIGCLILFADYRRVGWWLTFWAAVPMSLEVLWLTFRSLRPRPDLG